MRRRRCKGTTERSAGVTSLRKATYKVQGDSLTYQDTLLGQYMQSGLSYVPLTKGSPSYLSSRVGVLDSCSVVEKEGHIIYQDTSMSPDTAKQALLEALRDCLESKRMALNYEVRQINKVLAWL